MQHILYGIIEENDNEKDTSSRKMIPHCHLLADYRKLLPGAANIHSLQFLISVTWGRAYFFV